MKIEVRKVSATQYELQVEEVKVISAKISQNLYQFLEKKINKSEFIRNTILQIIYNNTDLTNIIINENRNKVITFRTDYQIYKKMLLYAKRYDESLNEFINRAIYWGMSNDSICL
jgi:hypothetical protein